MLAFVYDLENKLKLMEVPRPQLKEDCAIVKVMATSICGTDFRTYMYGSKKISPPRIIGHEFAGIIEEVGSKIIGFHPGDRISVAPAIGCGKCYSCGKGHTNMCDELKSIGFQYDGTFAQYIAVPLQAFEMGNVNKLGALIEDEEATLAEPIACAVNGQEFLNIKEGDSVAIFGSGFIGCIHAELAMQSGAGMIIMSEIAKKRIEQAIKLVPKIKIVNPAEKPLHEEVMRLTQGRGADVVIVACSSGKAQEDAIKIAAKRGRISLFGGIPGEAKGFLDSNEIHYKELSVFGVHASTPLQNKKVIDWISTGRLKIKKYISRVYPLKDIVNAFEAIKNENILKAIVKPFD